MNSKRIQSSCVNTAPSFQDGAERFVADRCEPLIEAVERGELRLHALGRGSYPGDALPSGELPGLLSVGVWDAAHDQSWGLPTHRNEGIELTFRDSGDVSVTIEGTEGVLHHDEFMVTRPWQPHCIGNPNISAGRLVWVIIDVGVRRPHQAWQWPGWVILSVGDRERLTTFLRQNEHHIWSGSDSIRRCFENIADALEGGSHPYSQLAVMINELLLCLLQTFEERRIPLAASLTNAERSVSGFIAELESSLQHPWTLPEMAEHCELGVTRFVHYFRRLKNMAPMQYLKQARVEFACTLLIEQPEATITDVAFRCGFSSSQYFSRTFHAEMGMAPRAYRQGLIPRP